MESPSEDKKPETPLAVQIILLVASLGVTVALMYYSFTYPYPSGPPSVAIFVLFWLREFIFLAFSAVVLVFCIAAWLVQLIRCIRAKGTDAL